MAILGSTIKGVSKAIAIIGKTVILIIGKTVYSFSSSSKKDDPTYEKIANFFEKAVLSTGEVTGNLADNLIEIISKEISNGRFKSIHCEMEEIFSKEKDSSIKKCKIGDSLRMEYEKFSLYKPNSIAIYKGYEHLGYLDEETSKVLIPLINQGYNFKSSVEKIIKGKKGKGYNLKIFITALSENKRNN